MNIEDIEPGNSYACRFYNEDDETRLGIITVRDQNQRLVRLVDPENEQEYVTSWDDIWDIDTVEWVNEEE